MDILEIRLSNKWNIIKCNIKLITILIIENKLNKSIWKWLLRIFR